jgi:hypothetical protein
MFSPEVHYLVCKEISKDLRQNAARQQLIKTAGLRRADSRESFRRMASWVGTRLVTWGSKLRRYDQGRHQTLTQRG